MTNFIFALMLGAGLGALVYSFIGKQIGYGNPQTVWTIVIVASVIGTIVAYTIFAFFLPSA